MRPPAEQQATPNRPRPGPGLALLAGVLGLLLSHGAPGGEGAPSPDSPGGVAVEASEAPGHAYRLRVRGLHALLGAEEPSQARLEIGARLATEDRRVVIEARLLEESSGRVLWEKVYDGHAATPEGVRQAVTEALREAMGLTREGVRTAPRAI